MCSKLNQEKALLSVSEFNIRVEQDKQGNPSKYYLTQGGYIQGEGSLDYCISQLFIRLEDTMKGRIKDCLNSGASTIKSTISMR